MIQASLSIGLRWHRSFPEPLFIWVVEDHPRHTSGPKEAGRVRSPFWMHRCTVRSARGSQRLSDGLRGGFVTQTVTFLQKLHSTDNKWIYINYLLLDIEVTQKLTILVLYGVTCHPWWLGHVPVDGPRPLLNRGRSRSDDANTKTKKIRYYLISRPKITRRGRRMDWRACVSKMG